SMADMNIPADNVPTEHAPAVAPPTRTDDQILSLSKWVPIGKRLYSGHLDEQWFNLHKDILRDALDITPANDNNPFEAPPLSDTVIKYVNTLGYPSTLRNVSAMYVNAPYQPWRAILSMINMCLTGITHHSNIDYAERIWEEFVQSIQTFLTDRKNLATEARGKKKILYLLIPNVSFTKLIIHHLRTKHNIHPRTGSPLHYSHEESVLNTFRFVGKDGKEVFGMPIPDALLTDEITKNIRLLKRISRTCILDAKATKSKIAKQTKPSAPKASKVTKPPKPTPTTTEPSKKDQSKKRKLVKETSDAPSPTKRSKAGKVTKQRKPKSPLQLVDEFVDEGVPEQEPVYGDEEADIQRAVELSIKEQAERTQGPARPVVIREPDSGRIQPLPDVQGKGKEKVSDEQVALDLLTLQTPKKKSPAEQYIFQRRTPTTLTPSGTLNLFIVPPQSSHDVHAGPNLEHMEFEVTNASTQQNPKQMDEEFTTTAYPSVQENLKLPTEDKSGYTLRTGKLRWNQHLSSSTKPYKNSASPIRFLVEKSQEDEPDKSNTEAGGFQSMVTTELDLPTVDMKEILQQRMFKDDSYKANIVIKTCASGALGTLGASESSQLPPPLPPPSTGTSGSTLQQGREVPSSSKTTASAQQSMAWTICDTRYESTGIVGAQELSPSDDLMHDDSAPDEQVHVSDDQDSRNDHTPAAADSRKDWWKPLPEEEGPATPEPAWTIPSSHKSDVENNWASALATTYEPPAENSLLAKIRDIHLT
ncbi:retrovirus-related pol polyprotein from transposon TNT 1-94, partial [Tanacetum coccineum]